MDTGLREVLGGVGCGLLVAVDEQVELANPALLRLFGLAEREWRGAPVQDLLDAVAATVADGASFLTRCARAVADGRPVTEDLTTLDGRVLECDFQPVGGPAGGRLWLVWDVSPDRAAELDRIRRQRAEIIAGQLGARAHRARADEAELTGRRLAERNEALVAVDVTRKELLATASHELRTPLTSILSFSELLGDASGGRPEVAQYAEVVHRNARRLLDTVEDLLMLAGLGSSPHPLDQAPVDIVTLVRQTVEDLAPIAAAAGVETALAGELVDASDSPMLVVVGSSTELARMMTNVVDNAVKYSDPGGRVEICAEHVGDRVAICVADRGTGIPAAEVDLVFGQFFRASTARASDRPGTGLGLALAQGIVGQHGGTIELTSELGRGTMVSIELPLATPTGAS